MGEGVQSGEIKALSDLQPRSIAGRLRKLMPEIDRKRREGVAAADIVEALEAAGIKVSVQTLCKYLYRWRTKARQSGSSGRAMMSDAAPMAKSALPAIDEGRTEDSTDVIVSEASISDDGSLEAFRDPKVRDAFAEQFMKPPLPKSARKKGSEKE